MQIIVQYRELLSLPDQFDDFIANYSELEDWWAKAENIMLNKNHLISWMPEIYTFLLSQQKSEFRSSLLVEISENAELSVDQLVEIYKYEDIGCQVSLALRDNLPAEFVDYCLNDGNEEVVMHLELRLKKERLKNKKASSNSE